MAHTVESRARAYEKIKRRRAEWFAANGPCKCGAWIDLELDHIDPSKKVGHSIWSWSAMRREQELRKCQILCSECHKHKTALELKARFYGRSNPKDRALQPDQVRMMRKEYALGVDTIRTIAGKYGISHATLLRVAKRRHYRDVA